MPMRLRSKLLERKNLRFIGVFVCLLILVQVALGISQGFGALSPQAAAAQPSNVSFTPGIVVDNANNPTTLQFGPDNRLYVGVQNGNIFAYNIKRNGAADYTITNTELIDEVRSMPNYFDDGTLCLLDGSQPENDDDCTFRRQLTGIYVAGTMTHPIIYATSSDPRIGAGGGGNDKNVDTNSGVVSRLECIGGMDANNQCTEWEKIDLVRGLPRSEENHSVNGILLDERGPTPQLLVAVGGNTNAGSPSNNFTFITEYTYAAAIVAIDLDGVMALNTQTDAQGQKYKYNLPTVNGTIMADPEDNPDPWGGEDGFNQAMWDNHNLVTLYATGFRNPYDIVLTENGRLYTVDNGANGSWGGYPEYEESYDCTNNFVSGEPGSIDPGPDPSTYPAGIVLHDGANGTVASDNAPDSKVNNLNGLHFVTEGYYGGHPAPVRGNPAGAGLYFFKNNEGSETEGVAVYLTETADLPTNWPPVPVSEANPVECDFQNSGEDDGALANFGPPTNGITEYTASNFDNDLKGDLLAVGLMDNYAIFQIKLDETGTVATNCPELTDPFNKCDSQTLLDGNGIAPLDITAQGDDDIFPGTIWVAYYGSNDIMVFEPADYGGSTIGPCDGDYDNAKDEDNDGYTNADEIDNGTNPCNGGSVPSDWDGTLIGGYKVSDLNDPDDDDDTLIDTVDHFVLDPNNGMTVSIPVRYDLFNSGGGFFGLDLMGLMANGTDYLELIDNEDSDGVRQLIAGGTAGLFSDIEVGQGDALNGANDLLNGFQFGFDIDSSTPPFIVQTRVAGEFLGGTPGGSKSHGMFIGTGDQDNYIELAVNSAGIEFVVEEGGTQNVAASSQLSLSGHLDEIFIDLYIAVDPATQRVQGFYSTQSDPTVRSVGGAVTVSGDLAAVLQGTYQVDGLPSGMAAGFMATSADAAEPFVATWDFVDIYLQDPPTASVTPTTVEFQPVMVGSSSSPQSIEVTNEGGAFMGDVTITDVQIGGANAAQFSHDFVSDVVLQPGESTTIEVTFSPTSKGNNITANLQITHDGDNVSPQTVDLSGVGYVTNEAPVVSGIGDQQSVEGDDVADLGLAVDASDSDGPLALTYTATGLPAGVNLGLDSGVFSGVIATGAAANSPYTVEVSVSDGVSSTVESFAWVVGVNQAPTVELITDQVNVEGDDIGALGLAVTAADSDGPDSLSYTATGLPAGISLGATNGVFTGTIAEGAADSSPYNVTVTVSDGQTEAAVNFTWTVFKPFCNPMVSYCSYMPFMPNSGELAWNVEP